MVVLFPLVQWARQALLRLWMVSLEWGTYEMASIMSMPISTQQWAWSALASGSPETQ